MFALRIRSFDSTRTESGLMEGVHKTKAGHRISAGRLATTTTTSTPTATSTLINTSGRGEDDVMILDTFESEREVLLSKRESSHEYD